MEKMLELYRNVLGSIPSDSHPEIGLNEFNRGVISEFLVKDIWKAIGSSTL